VDERFRTGRETAVSSGAGIETQRQSSLTLTRDSVSIGHTSKTRNRCLPDLEHFFVQGGSTKLTYHTMRYLYYRYTA
jgi:hypothetical protein